MNPFNAIPLGPSAGAAGEATTATNPDARAERGVFEALFNQVNDRPSVSDEDSFSARTGQNKNSSWEQRDQHSSSQNDEWEPIDRMPPTDTAGPRFLTEDSVKGLMETTRSEGKPSPLDEPSGKSQKHQKNADDTEELNESKKEPAKDKFTESAESKKRAEAEKVDETEENTESEEEKALKKAQENQAKNAKDSKKSKIERALKAAAMEKAAEKETDKENGTRIALNRLGMVMEAKMEAKTIAAEESAEELLTGEIQDNPAGDWMSQGKSGQEARDQQARQAPMPAITQAAPTQASHSNPTAQLTQAPASPSVLLEKVWHTVTTFQARGADNWVVQLRPDGDTRLELAIRQGANGIEIAARIHKGDLQAVKSQWGELQAALAERGVHLKALEPGESFKDLNRENFAGKEADREGQAAFAEADRQDGDPEEKSAPQGAPAAQPDNSKNQRRQRAANTANGWEGWA